jgi:hypothetical protein
MVEPEGDDDGAGHRGEVLMTNPNEIRAITERVKELRQELEAVEARLRDLTGDPSALAPIEPMDSPTVLTTNHAQRQARRDVLVPALAAFAAVVVLASGIGIGFALRPSPAPAPQVLATSMPSAPAEAPPPAPPPPPSAPAPTEPPVAVSEPVATTAPTAIASAAPVASALIPVPPSTLAAPIPAPTPRGPGRQANVDRGF